MLDSLKLITFRNMRGKMSHVRYVQVLFWGIVCLLISPSKAAAVAYGIMILVLLVAVMITLEIVRVVISAIKWVIRRLS